MLVATLKITEVTLQNQGLLHENSIWHSRNEFPGFTNNSVNMRNQKFFGCLGPAGLKTCRSDARGSAVLPREMPGLRPTLRGFEAGTEGGSVSNHSVTCRPGFGWSFVQRRAHVILPFSAWFSCLLNCGVEHCHCSASGLGGVSCAYIRHVGKQGICMICLGFCLAQQKWIFSYKNCCENIHI